MTQTLTGESSATSLFPIFPMAISVSSILYKWHSKHKRKRNVRIKKHTFNVHIFFHLKKEEKVPGNAFAWNACS